MAGNKRNSGGAKAANVPSSATKMGDIQTAAKSTMEPKGYEHGYPSFENEMLANQTNTLKRKK